VKVALNLTWGITEAFVWIPPLNSGVFLSV
jgi:hypothetical protein